MLKGFIANLRYPIVDVFMMRSITSINPATAGHPGHSCTASFGKIYDVALMLDAVLHGDDPG